MKKSLEFKYVPIDDVYPNPWNTNVVSPEKFLQLKAGMEQVDWFKGIVCRKLDNGNLQVLGGYHRVQAAKELGWTEVPVQIVSNVSDSRARQIGIMDNGEYGQDDQAKLADLIRELDDEQVEVLPYDEDEMSNMLAASEINFDSLGLDTEDDDGMDAAEATAKPPETHKILRMKVHNSDLEDVLDVLQAVMAKKELDSPDSQQNMGDALVELTESYKTK